jgi:3-hydroxyacyl-[acyl-carrier-protein] dehydratase
MGDQSDVNTMQDELIEAEEIATMIPHRYPFLLIDRITGWQLEPEKSIRALKNVTINEPFFQGHFPGHPIMPGVLIVEAMAQAAGVLVALCNPSGERVANLNYLVKLDNARFKKTVVPGDQLLIEVVEKRRMRNMGQFVCAASVEGKVVASCDIMCAGKS